jgi:hypothetical protein
MKVISKNKKKAMHPKSEWAFFAHSNYVQGTGCLDILQHTTDGSFVVGYDALKILEGDKPLYTVEWLPNLEAVRAYCKEWGF